MTEAIVATLSAAGGFALKALWDYYSKRALEDERVKRTKRLEFLEKQLTHFYWPLLFQLRKNDIVWERVMDNPAADGLAQELNAKIERNFFYPSNQRMLEIIEENYYLAQAPAELDEAINRFIRHQAVFQGIRESIGDQVDPVRFGEPWPEHFSKLIEARTQELQQQYDALLSRHIG